jgi:hypothetical protein
MDRLRAIVLPRVAAALLASVLNFHAGVQAGDSPSPSDIHYYSTAAPPAEYDGPKPVLLARLDESDGKPVAPARSAQPPAAPVRETTKIAAAPAPPRDTTAHTTPAAASTPELDSIGRAVQIMSDCQSRFEQVKDYTCVFYKRERLHDGRMTGQHEMVMKFRCKPTSVYFKFVRPTPGREAIYVAGRNNGKAWVHDVGLGKLLAGTISLDPLGSMAMEDCRHPITDAGIGHMINEIVQAWKLEMRRGETQVAIHPTARVGTRPCTMIESTHPLKHTSYKFHKIKVYVDHEHGLPIRFEAYDWPKHAGAAPELLEEYTYDKLRLNVGLTETDFDPGNKHYSFGRF